MTACIKSASVAVKLLRIVVAIGFGNIVLGPRILPMVLRQGNSSWKMLDFQRAPGAAIWIGPGMSAEVQARNESSGAQEST